jgi:hypothetical protein
MASTDNTEFSALPSPHCRNCQGAARQRPAHLQERGDRAPCLEARLPRERPAHLVDHARVVEDVEHRQPMRLACFEVVRVVRGRDLDRAGAEGHVNKLRVLQAQTIGELVDGSVRGHDLDRARIIKDVDHRQAMCLARFEVVGVVRGRDLDRAGAKKSYQQVARPAGTYDRWSD